MGLKIQGAFKIIQGGAGGGTQLQNVLNAVILSSPMLERDLDETCIEFFPGLGQVGFSHNFLCLLFKSWRKLIKRQELF